MRLEIDIKTDYSPKAILLALTVSVDILISVTSFLNLTLHWKVVLLEVYFCSRLVLAINIVGAVVVLRSRLVMIAYCL